MHADFCNGGVHIIGYDRGTLPYENWPTSTALYAQLSPCWVHIDTLTKYTRQRSTTPQNVLGLNPET
jgi:hypothetical protein